MAKTPGVDQSLNDFLNGKSAQTVSLLNEFVRQFQSFGDVQLYPAKTMIGISTPRKRIAYVTQLGKNFIHVVFPFPTAHHDNLCFQKIAQVPGDASQFNHHFRMFAKEDVNKEVRKYMKLAYEQGS